jgi:hypothetical protein
MPVAAVGCPGARSPVAGAANDFGPPQRPGTSERSVPSAVGPIDCRSRSCPRARGGGADPGSGSGECRTRARAGGLAAGAPMASGSSVLRRQRHRKPLPAFLPPAGQYRPPPSGSHPGAKSVFVDAALVPRPIRWLHSGIPPNEPGKLVGRERRGQGSRKVRRRRKGRRRRGGLRNRESSAKERKRAGEPEVDNVENVENGGNKCASFLSLLYLFYLLRLLRLSACQAPIDISISRP